MLKFFRRSKSKNTPNNNNTGPISKNSKDEVKSSLPLNSQQAKLLDEKNQRTCVLPPINSDINKFRDRDRDREKLNKFENNHYNDQNTTYKIKSLEIPSHHVSVDHNTNYDDDYHHHHQHHQKHQQQQQQQHQFSPCNTKIYNSKECQKRKSSLTANSSRNEIVDQVHCRFEDVPSKGSTNIDRSTIDQQQQQQQLQQEKDIQYHPVSNKQQNKDRRQRTFNPINKSREFFYDIIMAKGRNRNRNRNNSTNNQGGDNNHHSKYEKQQHTNQQDHHLINKNSNKIHNVQNQNKNEEIKNVVEVRSNKNNNNNERSKSEINNLTESDKFNEKNSKLLQSENNFHGSGIGYQITKSKNSTNLVMKYEQEEEDDENNDGDDRVEHADDDNQNQLIIDDTGNTDTAAINSRINNDHENENSMNLENCAGANDVNLCENSSHLNSPIQIFDYDYKQQQQNDETVDCSRNESIKDTFDFVVVEDVFSPSTIIQNNENINEIQNTDEHSNGDDNNEEISVVEGSTLNTYPLSEFSILNENHEENEENDVDHNENLKQHPQNDVVNDQFLNELIREEVEKISELTECDRDCYIKMGQPNSKSENALNTASLLSLNESSVNNNNNNNNNLSIGCSSNSNSIQFELPQTLPKNSDRNVGENDTTNNDSIVIPTIIVADYSDQTKPNCNSEIETDIFYDSSQIPLDNINNNDQFLSPSSIPITIIGTTETTDQSTSKVNITDLDDDDDDNDDDGDEWHFVAGNDSDRVTIEDDNDPDNDHITYNSINVNNNNKNNKRNNKKLNNKFIDDTTISYSSLSTITSSTSTEKQSDSPDSGLGRSISSRVLLIDTSQLDCDDDSQKHEQQQQQQHQTNQQQTFLNTIKLGSEDFIRGSSTDCDENFLQSDYETYFDNLDDNNQQYQKKQHILIDSISLPDVVVESTGMGSSQSIPIKIEVINNIEEQRTTTTTTPTKLTTINSTRASSIVTDHNDNETRNLVNQEARFSAQLEDAQKIAYAAQSKVNDLQAKIDDLEKELSVKSWNVDRLQAELKAAQKEDECVRKKLKILEEEKENLRQKFSETEDELSKSYEELQTQYQQLKDKYEEIKFFTNSLKAQLAFAQSDAKQCRLDKERLEKEKDEEIKTLKEALENSQEERKALEQKWHKEFETLRTQNADREEHLISDCEWKMRTMQKSCKEKLEKAEKERKEALERAEEIEMKAKEEMNEVKHLKSYEAEVRQLRGLTGDQRQSISSMNEQIEELRSELENANEKLEEQIAAVRKIRTQCENALSDKDRQMMQKIDEIRIEVSEQWENKLLTEMTRLKTELEVVSIEDRQEALQRLQAEHVEDIKALTVRYNANEQELREELESLREQLDKKEKEFKELKTKSEEVLLESRLQLERADRDYQCAMNREEEKKKILIANLREEFNQEKAEMEEKFRERLGQVKDEFAKELAAASEELTVKHRKQLEQQWEQLIAEKEEALQLMETRHRIRLEEAEIRIKNLEIEHQRDIKDMKTNFEIERTTLESRDLQNSQEIEQLHRKCRCLTNLFEEMRMRYERRDPRPEDLREIAELRSRCESQERDLHLLTERLREMQIEMQEQRQQQQSNPGRKGKIIRKPPPKNIPISCDVIYEENEENETSLSSSSPPPQLPVPQNNINNEKEIMNGTMTSLEEKTTQVYEDSTAVAGN